MITELKVRDSYRIDAEKVGDRRGFFFEAWRHSELSEATGIKFEVAQVNCSVSVRDTLRGIHGTQTPPGQAKLVTCVRGAAIDVVVDLRVGSPTFGEYDMTVLEAGSGVSVFMPDGMGHAFLTLADDTALLYSCDAEYVPGTMIDLDALDPELGIPWQPQRPVIRSDKDANAPTLAQALARGLLPTYEGSRR